MKKTADETKRINGTTSTMRLACQMCGRPVVRASKRPAQYCSATCRNLFKFLGALSRCIDAVDFDPEHRTLIRGELFRIANSIKQEQNHE